jgi:manganese/zinc/iron transport system permease protein
MSPDLEIQLIAVVTAVACAVPGVFLVLRRMAMLSDAISHSILPGIVVAFFLTGSLGSPLLILGAAATGVLTVALIELLYRTGLVKQDAAIGVTFPFLFSVGVILVSRYAGNVHLDIDVVLLGELAFAPFDRIVLSGVDLGPQALWTMGSILLLDLIFVAAFFKELQLATFDPGLAASLGLRPGLLHYALMGLVSITAVGAFDAVGSILVVALMIAPAATASLLTDRLGAMLATSSAIAAFDAIAGYWLARWADASIAGMMATAAGIVFALALVAAPGRGLVAVARRRASQRTDFAVSLLAIHILHHEATPGAIDELRADSVHHHLGWERRHTAGVVRHAERRGVLRHDAGLLRLTPQGRRRAGAAMMQ